MVNFNPIVNANTQFHTLAGRLRQRRLELGLSQQMLADKVGSSQAVIQKIENGRSLRPRNIEAIGEAMGVHPAWLMFGVPGPGDVSPEALEVARRWQMMDEQRRGKVLDTLDAWYYDYQLEQRAIRERAEVEAMARNYDPARAY